MAWASLAESVRLAEGGSPADVPSPDWVTHLPPWWRQGPSRRELVRNERRGRGQGKQPRWRQEVGMGGWGQGEDRTFPLSRRKSSPRPKLHWGRRGRLERW